jgi:predicted Na+-dependent transporter
MAFATICVAVGIALGLRFNVVVLISAIALAAVFALIFGVARGDGFWSIALAVVTVGMAIKLGYFVGIFLAKRIQ